MSIGGSEGATSLRADRFVLAWRSGASACLRLGESSFQEGAAGRVTLDVPSPQPSAAASRAVMEFLYTGSLSSGGGGGGGGSASCRPHHPYPLAQRRPGRAARDGPQRRGRRVPAAARQQEAAVPGAGLIAAGLDDGSAFSLLRRSSAMNQEEAKGPIMEHLLKRGAALVRRTSDGARQDGGGGGGGRGLDAERGMVELLRRLQCATS